MGLEFLVGSFELIVLLALQRLKDNAYGVSIRHELERRTGGEVCLGAIYSTLNRLEKKKYVSSWNGDPTPERGGRRKRYFKLEELGHLALNQSLNVIHNLDDSHRASVLTPKAVLD